MTKTSSRPRRPRLLVLNQYYWPGNEATARLLTDLCDALSADFEITVVTGRLRDTAEAAGTKTRHGVRIVRVSSTAFDRRQLLPRALNYATFLLQAFRAGLASGRPDVVLCMTDPPVIGDIGLVLACRFRVPLVVISQDVFPEIAIELGRLENPVVVGVLRQTIQAYLRRADRIVAIGETMRRRLEVKGVEPARLRVIPNWVDTGRIVPAGRDNDWARANHLAGRFVVMHSGNIGHAQDLETLIRASTFLRDLDDLSILIIGAGARHHDLVSMATVLEAESVRFLGYQPDDLLAQSLSAADVHFVGLSLGLAGYVVPSRLYGILAAGRPVLAAVEEDSETAGVVRQADCGIVLPPGRPDRLAAAIRAAHAGELDLEGMGHRARSYATSEATREVAMGRYRELLAELVRVP